jgi:hypothetical protein
MQAASAGNVEVIETLLALGANESLKDTQGETALAKAQKYLKRLPSQQAYENGRSNIDPARDPETALRQQREMADAHKAVALLTRP